MATSGVSSSCEIAPLSDQLERLVPEFVERAAEIALGAGSPVSLAFCAANSAPSLALWLLLSRRLGLVLEKTHAVDRVAAVSAETIAPRGSGLLA